MVPIIIQAPRYFAGAITLGDVQQTGSAFGQVHDALSFFRNAYDNFAAYRAVLNRLTGLLDSDADSRHAAEGRHRGGRRAWRSTS